MYSITEGFSPILCCRPDVSFKKNEEEAIPHGGKKYLGTIKPSTRMILVHVQGAGTCPCMEINVSVQYNGGLLPDIILSTPCVFLKK